MIKQKATLLMLLSAWLRAGPATAAEARPATAIAWQKASPQSQRMDDAKLDALRASLARRQTKAFLVIRNDRIVHCLNRDTAGIDFVSHADLQQRPGRHGPAGPGHWQLQRDDAELRPGPPVPRGDLRLIPHFTWANRGVTEMAVWIKPSPAQQ